jgi:hypothetical protein
MTVQELPDIFELTDEGKIDEYLGVKLQNYQMA